MSQTLNTTASAQQQLYKRLLKIKAVAEHPDLSTQVREPLKHSTDAAVLNVTARLCNSNQGKEALAAAVVEVQRALGLDVEGSLSLKKRRKRAKDYENATPPTNGTQAGGQSVTEDPDELSVRRDRTAEVDVRDDESEGSFGALQDRLAGSSDESEDQVEQRYRAQHLLRKSTEPLSNGYNLAADPSISGSDSEGRSASPEPQKAPAPKKSNFLPSLTMGGYISGSGSELDDDLDAAPKKNRRGQRARQQIWEKKFGTKAKHLKKQDRNQGWDPKRGATDGTERRGGSAVRRDIRASPDYGPDVIRRPKPVTEVKKKKPPKDDSGPIHPSWEAAKRAKEKKEAPVAFQGKKITFD